MFFQTIYPTYQVFVALGVSCIITMVLMPLFIKLMKKEGVGQQVRADGPQQHLIKQGTPTMGGVVMLVSIVLTCIALAQWNTDLILAMAAMLLTGSLGLLDDIESVAHGRSLGFLTTTVNLGENSISIPWLYLFFVFLLMAGLSNAVNLTDGLDGLAGGCVMVVMIFMAAVAFRYGESSLAVFAASIAGACIGFLWFNSYPASIFMGDTGSLAWGAAFAALAVLTKTEVVSLVMGGLFIIEALSVIIQVVSYKTTKKRVFLMAPLHHHFEKLGWNETKVVFRFWIISGAFAALGFALYFQLH